MVFSIWLASWSFCRAWITGLRNVVVFAYSFVQSKKTSLHIYVEGTKDKKALSLQMVAVSFFLTFFSVLPMIFAYLLSPTGFGPNHYPRDTQQSMTGWKKRAVAAHYNSLEAFPAFAVGVFIAISMNADLVLLGKLSIIFIWLRLIYHGVYLTGVSSWLRTAVWMTSWFILASIYLSSFYTGLFSQAPSKLFGTEVVDLVNQLLQTVGYQFRFQ